VFSLSKRRKARVCWPSSLTIRNGCLCSLIFFFFHQPHFCLLARHLNHISFLCRLRLTTLWATPWVSASVHAISDLPSSPHSPPRDSTTSTIDCLIHILQRLVNLGTAAVQHDQLPIFRYLQTPKATYNNFQSAGIIFSLRPSHSINRVEIR